MPYRTSYYKETWGFCLSQEQLERLEPGEYEVLIDSGLTDGALSYGEMFLRGRTSAEVLFSCHVCHPSLANDNLSGVALLTKLAQVLAGGDLRYSYRFLFIPGTIGSITWLARNEERTCQIRHGLVAACVGDAGKLHYKRSRRGDSEIDRAVTQVLRERGTEHEVRDFTPYGYDERQYCSPGFNLPVGSLTAHAARPFPRIPHLRRQPVVRAGRSDSPTRSTPTSQCCAYSRTTPAIATCNPSASRNWASAGCTRPSADWTRDDGNRPCCGCSTSAMRAIRYWKLPNGPACRST